jgi:hypothetical protein
MLSPLMKISRQEKVQRYKIVHILNFLIIEYNNENAYQTEAPEYRRLF